MVTKTWNGTEQNRLFHFIFYQIVHPKAIQYMSLNPKNFNLGIPNPKFKHFANNRKIKEHFVLFSAIPFRILTTTISNCELNPYNDL